LTIIGMLAVYEIRATWMVVYDHPDTPREMLIYVQSSPDIPLISQDIHELAISQTRNTRTLSDPIGGHTMPVIMDIGDNEGEYSLAWPFQWYLRDFQRIESRKADFFQNANSDSFQVAVDPKQPNGEKEFAPVVLVSVPHMTDATRQALEANYVKRSESKLNWWFPEGSKCDPDVPGYKRFYYSTSTLAEAIKDCKNPNLDPTKFGGVLAPLLWPLDRTTWSDTWRFLIYREIPAPLRLDGREMEVWVRRDLSASGSAQPSVAGGGALRLVADQVFGMPGKESGQLDQPHGLAVDSKGNVFVSDAAAHRVEVYGPDGKLMREIGSFGSAPGQFNEPHGLAVDTQGNLYVADTWNARIDKFDPNGKFLKSWGEGKPDPSGRLVTMTDGTEDGNAAAPLGFYGPRGVAVDKQGNVYIADTGNKRIVVTDGEGNFLYQWGHAGADLGAFNEPIGVALDGQGNLYVADTWNSRVQVFGHGQDTRISPIPSVTWNVSGWQPSTYFDPFLAASEGGQVFVSVPSRDIMLEANTRGDVLLRWGGKGDDMASLTQPSGVAVGPDGSVYVVDHGGGRVLRFSLPKVAAP
ncbi:MAG TPA: TIGR03663 family protein, partial [Roseiflexaceae bacterium]